jgi:ATP-dependent DNA helicase RecQ
MMLGSIAERLGRPPVLALTATAPPEVQDDIIEQLGMRDPFRIVGELVRPNLDLEVLPTVNDERRTRRSTASSGRAEGTGIVYVATVKEAERLHEELSRRLAGRAVPRQAARREAAHGGAGRLVGRRGQGGDRDQRLRARHRQAGHPLRRPLPLPRLARGVLPGGGARGARRAPARCAILYREEDRAVQGYFLGGKYPDIEEAARWRGWSTRTPEGARPLDEIAEAADVPRRKARIVLTLLKRHGMVREHRGGEWERLAEDVTAADLSRELRRLRGAPRADRAKLEPWSATAGRRSAAPA